VIVARHLSLGVVFLVMLGACSVESTPTPVQADGEYLAYPERIDLVVACVEERGFEASSYRGFGVRIEYAGKEQEEIATRAEGECWEEVEQRFPAPPPLSHEERYYYMLDVAECLRDLGYDIPEAPSLEAYVDQMSADRPSIDLWDPYSILMGRGVDTYAIQREQCPPEIWAR